MHKLMIVPDSDGYSSTDGTEWVGSRLDGGSGRFRRDKIGAAKSVNVKWTLNPSLYQYFRSFYSTVGSATFLCDLLSEDGSGPAEHECVFMPGSVTLPTQVGLTYIQQAQLEVKPLARDTELDQEILVAYEEMEFPELGFTMLEHLVNVSMPEAMSA